jgi:hypothetical protein
MEGMEEEEEEEEEGKDRHCGDVFAWEGIRGVGYQ